MQLLSSQPFVLLKLLHKLFQFRSTDFGIDIGLCGKVLFAILIHAGPARIQALRVNINLFFLGLMVVVELLDVLENEAVLCQEHLVDLLHVQVVHNVELELLQVQILLLLT